MKYNRLLLVLPMILSLYACESESPIPNKKKPAPEIEKSLVQRLPNDFLSKFFTIGNLPTNLPALDPSKPESLWSYYGRGVTTSSLSRQTKFLPSVISSSLSPQDLSSLREEVRYTNQKQYNHHIDRYSVDGTEVVFESYRLEYRHSFVRGHGHPFSPRWHSRDFEESLLTLPPRQFVERYGTNILLGYGIGHRVTIRICRMPKALLVQRGTQTKTGELIQGFEQAGAYSVKPIIDGEEAVYIQIESTLEARPEPSLLRQKSTPDIRTGVYRWFTKHSQQETPRLITILNYTTNRIEDFILEDNLKSLVHANRLEHGELRADKLPETFRVPVIRVGKFFVGKGADDEPVYDVCAVLTNRYGQQILLNQCFWIGDENIVFSEFGDPVNMDAYHRHLQEMKDPAKYRARVAELADQLSKCFKCQISQASSSGEPIGGLSSKTRGHMGFYLYDYQGKPYQIRRLIKYNRLHLFNPKQRTSLTMYHPSEAADDDYSQTWKKNHIDPTWAQSLSIAEKDGYRHIAL